MPPFFDPNEGDNVTLSIKSISRYQATSLDYISIQVDQKAKSIVLSFDRAIIPYYKTIDELELTLQDQTGLKTTSKYTVNYEKRFGTQFDYEDPSLKKRECQAKIKSIDIFGEMIVEFNQTMNKDANVSTLNESTVDIYIEPFYDEDTSLVERMKHGMNLTWNLTKIYDNRLYFKLRFENPVVLSKELLPDVLVLHIKNLSMHWYCFGAFNFLHKDYHTLRY